MGSFAAVKILIVPAVISLILFVTLRYGLGPLWRRYRMGYSRILPLDAPLSERPSLWQWFRGHLPQHAIWDPTNFNFIGRTYGVPVFRRTAHSDDGISEDGEELADVDDVTWNTLEQASRIGRPDDQPRLSRDLEEGFRSESSDDDDDDDDDDEDDNNARR